MQCTLALETNGLKLGIDSNSMTSAELLDRVKRYALQFRKMQWTTRAEVRLGTGGVHNSTDSYGEFLALATEDPASIQLMRLPSILRGVTERKWVAHHRMRSQEFIVEASQDLLVLVESKSL